MRAQTRCRHEHARRALRGIGEQVAKAGKAVTGKAPVKRNRFIQLSGGTRTLNRELEAKATAGRDRGLGHQPALWRLRARQVELRGELQHHLGAHPTRVYRDGGNTVEAGALSRRRPATRNGSVSRARHCRPPPLPPATASTPPPDTHPQPAAQTTPQTRAADDHRRPTALALKPHHTGTQIGQICPPS
jgi:hypothetical protein